MTFLPPENESVTPLPLWRLGALLLTACAFLAVLLVPAFSKAPQKGETAPAAPDAFASVPIEAKAAVVYDLATGTTLYAKNAEAQLPLASLTKLLTVYTALTRFSPSATIVIPPDAPQVYPPRAFSAGEAFSLSDLARLTLTASLNDGAVAIADALSKRENASPESLLGAAAAALGLAQTYAVNGSGLDVSGALSGGYGSAADLARLAGALVNRAPEIAAATTEPTAQAFSKNGKAFTVRNTDPVVTSVPRLLLSKTGYTDLAGGNLALVFDAGIRHPVAIVVLGSSKKARFTDGTALVAATLAHFSGLSSL